MECNTGWNELNKFKIKKIILILKDYDLRTSISGLGNLEGGNKLIPTRIAIKISKDASRNFLKIKK